MKKIVICSLIGLISFVCIPSLFPHCELPCGIYGDEMRIKLIEEHITTIEKSMRFILSQEKLKEKNYNQLVRWINNKENHALYIQDIVSQYFLTQRIKPVSKEKGPLYDKYIEQLRLAHEMLIYAMKAKQKTDIKYVERLRSLLHDFSHVYFGPKTVTNKPHN
jgi:nickel superoxide dismutase